MSGFQVGDQVVVLDGFGDYDCDGVVQKVLGGGDYLVRVVIDGVTYDDQYDCFQLCDPALYD